MKQKEINTAENKVGAVMVVGGGIGGIQAALDLANSGYYVYLVEKSSSIGGRMSQLDKTFPTNDCAMCIIGPKLVECGRHLNIEMLTLSEIESLKGEEGNFRVRVRQQARYIDSEKCTGCGDCAEACPVSVPDEYNQRLGLRKATYLTYPQSVPRVYAIEKKDRPPCNSYCPAHINVQAYVAMIRAGKYREAIEIIMQDMPLPGVLGRVCVRFCEEGCNRCEVDEPVSINGLKRFVADKVDILSLPIPKITHREERVAIVGSGPSGLAAGYFLALDGFKPTIFEALDVPGGMLVVGIPEYRLPRDVLETEIENIKRFGVEIKTNSPIGKDRTIKNLFEEGYKAVYVSTGAQRGMKLGIPGEDRYENFHECVPWLREVNLGHIREINGKVVVIGGGNAAIDAARVSVRLGAEEVHIVYRRSRDEMPADPLEIEEALQEGVRLHILLTPKKIAGDNGVLKGVEVLKNRLGEQDSSGRRRPVPVKGSEFFISADHIIGAIGQRVDKSFATDLDEIRFSEYDLLNVNPGTLETTKKGVFAGGDVVTGPKTVIEAIAQGKKAAASIAAYLQGKEFLSYCQENSNKDLKKVHRTIYPENPIISRAKIPTVDVTERIKNFKECNLSMDEGEAKREAARCLDCGVCCECFLCVEACKAQAINHEMKDKVFDINVGSIILALGFEPYDPSFNDTYQYGRLSNVVTSLEFERILSASGPYEGQLVRPSDKKVPEKIAWLQCVGSRDLHAGTKSYCSTVCCTYAIKQALIAKEHSQLPLETAIFYLDIRTCGKDFEKYYNRAKHEMGVSFIKSRISKILPKGDTGNLLIWYTDEAGNRIEAEFDMVVLSIGIVVPQHSIDLAEKIGVELDPHNFASTSSFEPVKTSKAGVYVCGVFEAPKDIPETVAQASAAAARASAALEEVRGTRTKTAEYPPERNVSKEPIKIGVFVCNCGINIGGVANVPDIVEYAKTLPYVIYAVENLFSCSEDTQARMKEVILEKQLNRVVVASCSPRTHEPLFRETCRQAGLNPNLFEMANIRDQCTWVHMDEPDEATSKAKGLVRMAVARAAMLEQVYEIPQPVCQEGLVVGGGVAGMTAALGLAEQGFKIHLVEKENTLGGQALELHSTWKGEKIRPYVEDMVNKINEHPLVSVYMQTKVKDVSGAVGNYISTLVDAQGNKREVKHGVAIIASGGGSYKPEEYLYGEDPNIFLSLELDQEVAQSSERLKDINVAVFIQCVGSREPIRPYCSKVCCTHSIHSALTLKELNPDMDIFILYRDIRTYGEREDIYREARSKGVRFIRYDPDDKPRVEKADSKLRVTVKDQVIGMYVQIETDIITLAPAIVPPHGNDLLSRTFKIPMNQEGFFVEAHAKLRPVDFASEGMYVCGLAHGPKAIDETISQANAAVSRACTILAHREMMVGGTVAAVDPSSCGACLTCVRTCPYGVPFINRDGVAQIDAGRCYGCGMCVAECPYQAITFSCLSTEQLMAKIDACFG